MDITSQSTGECTNCSLLMDQCNELREEIKQLSNKIDSLTKFIYRNVDCNAKAVQCDIVCSSTSVATQCNSIDLNSSVTNSPNNTLITSDSSVNSESLQVNPDKTFSSSNAENLLRIFLDATSSNTAVFNNSLSIPSHVQPFTVFTENIFNHFNVASLEKSTIFDKMLHSRNVAYYGDTPYRYGNIVHNVRPFSDNKYLCEILTHLKTKLPSLNFNSALITKYRNGNDHINYHSDNESSIELDSDIITLSFGESRLIEFRPISKLGSVSSPSCLKVNNGELFLMTRESQDFYEHSVPRDDSTGLRVSITLRLLKHPVSPLNISQPCVTAASTPASDQLTAQNALNSTTSPSSKPTTLYISSSMFSGVKPTKMSSGHQDAVVLFYRGATVSQILGKLKQDQNFLGLDPELVTKVVLMCGTNNVDKVLGIPFSQCSSFASSNAVQYNSEVMNETFSSIDAIYSFLRTWNPTACINFLNILPRISKSRNLVINNLNQYIHNLCVNMGNTMFINTERERNLFTWKSYRRNNYFSKAGSDNVHLNSDGVVRLCKHLKYLVHN